MRSYTIIIGCLIGSLLFAACEVEDDQQLDELYETHGEETMAELDGLFVTVTDGVNIGGDSASADESMVAPVGNCHRWHYKEVVCCANRFNPAGGGTGYQRCMINASVRHAACLANPSGFNYTNPADCQNGLRRGPAAPVPVKTTNSGGYNNNP